MIRWIVKDYIDLLIGYETFLDLWEPASNLRLRDGLVRLWVFVILLQFLLSNGGRVYQIKFGSFLPRAPTILKFDAAECHYRHRREINHKYVNKVSRCSPLRSMGPCEGSKCIAVLWDMMPRSLVYILQRFGRAYCFHVQSSSSGVFMDNTE